MKASGKRQKGARLERKIASEIRRVLDLKAKRSFQSGAHWSWKSDIYAPGLNFSIEAKNQEKVRLWEFWDQAEKARKPFSPPVLMISGNYRPILAVMNLDDWLNLVKERNDWKELAEKLQKE